MSDRSYVRRTLSHVWWEVIFWHGGRAACRIFGRHNVTCRGRIDHRKQVTRG